MKRVAETYRNKNYTVHRRIFPLAIASLVLSIIVLSAFKGLLPLLVTPIFLAAITFFIFPHTRSAPFHKIVMTDSTIEIYDPMPKWLINIPKVQRFNIRDIRDIFFLPYDLKASVKTTRVKKGAFVRMQIERDPNMIACLVFRFTKGLNAYARYFSSLSIVDRKQILRKIKEANPKVRLRFGDFEKWGRFQ